MNSARRDWLPYLAGLIAVTVIVASLAAFAFYFEKQRFIERAQVATNNMAELQAQNVGALAARIDATIQSGALFFRHQQMPGPFRADELNEYLKHLESVVPELDGIRILDEHGLVRYGHNIPTTQRTNLSDRPFFRRARDRIEASGELIVDGPLFARIAQKWVLVFARRLNKPDGSFAGVIYANLATTQLDKVLSLVALGPHGAATVRTAELALVHRFPETKNAVGSSNVSDELRNAISTKPEGGNYLATVALDGIERTNAYRKVGNLPLYVIVGLATQDYLGSSQHNFFIIAGLAFLTIVISGVASYQGYQSHQKLARDLQERIGLNKALENAVREGERLNQQLALKAREAEAASAAKSAFLSNMSHELRTPLHQIQGLSQLVGRDPLTDRQAGRLKNLGEAVQRMTTLVDAVLELTQIESGNIDLSEEPIELQDVIAEVVAQHQPASAEKQLVLSIGTVPSLPGLVGDKRHLSQALNNYLSNAVRFTQAGTIEVRASVVSEEALSLLLRFEVEDTGIGIKPEDVPRLFSVFEQVDNSATRRFGGLGIGLAITRKIAETLGGEAGCESVYGRGSTFWFTVLLKQSAHGRIG